MLNVALPIKLHRNQELIHNSSALNVVVKSGKRFGKTELALYKLIKWAFAKPGGTFWYLTDTFRHAEEIGWKRLLQLIPRHLLAGTPLVNKLMVPLVGGSTIKMMGSENPDYLRGTELDGVVWEEAAYIKNGLDIWGGIIYGQLQGTGDEPPGPAFFISSPSKEGINWYSRFYEEALRRKSLGESWDAFKFTIYDNPLYRPEVIAAIKDGCTEDTWEVEYMANESAHAGQIISEFNHSLHIKDFENPKDSFFVRGLDWGIDHPTACLWIYVNLSVRMVYVSDEYKKSGKSIEESCGIIKQITGQRKVDWSVIDPSMAKRDKFNVHRQELDEFNKNGVWVIPGDNRVIGYDAMKMFFKKNMIRIHPKCRQLINEIQTVQWGDKTGEDLLDCLRYSLLRIHEVYFGGNLGLGAQEEPEIKRGANVFNLNDSLLFENKPNKKDLSWAYAGD